MIIPLACSIGNADAWEHHLRVPLHCQNHEFTAPDGEILITDHQKTTATMTNLLLSSANVPPRNEWGTMQQTKDACPSPKTPPTPLVPPIVWRGLLANAEASASPPDILTISYLQPVANRSSPFPSKGAATSNTNIWKLCIDTSLLYWCLIVIVRGCRPCWIIFLGKEDDDEDYGGQGMDIYGNWVNGYCLNQK